MLENLHKLSPNRQLADRGSGICPLFEHHGILGELLGAQSVQDRIHRKVRCRFVVGH